MGEAWGTRRLLVLRKLTRAIAELLQGQAKQHLATLTPLLRPGPVFGPFLEGAAKDSAPGSDQAFKELQALYEAVAGSRPYNIRKDLAPPLQLIGSAIEMAPLEYTLTIPNDQGGSKAVAVTRPLMWALTYAGYAPGRIVHTSFAPGRLKELLADRNRSGQELPQFVLHYLAMHLVASKQAGVARILESLRFPVGPHKSPEFGDLPLTCISSAVPTVLPPDEVILESTEISGKDAFEEVVDLDALATLGDPLKEQIFECARRHGEDLLPAPP